MLRKYVVLAQGPSTIPSFGLKIEARLLPVAQPNGSLLMSQLPFGLSILSLTSKLNWSSRSPITVLK